MCEGCTRDDFTERQRQRIRRTGELGARMHREWWRPNRRLRTEIRQIAAEDELDYAEHMTRDAQGRLVYRCSADEG